MDHSMYTHGHELFHLLLFHNILQLALLTGIESGERRNSLSADFSQQNGHTTLNAKRRVIWSCTYESIIKTRCFGALEDIFVADVSYNTMNASAI